MSTKREHGRRRLLVIVPALASIVTACPGDFDVENRSFPCRAPEDCVEGYQCHPTRYVCVPSSTVDGSLDSADGSIADGASRRGLGATCSPEQSCDEGFCVDGVCCETLCNAPCSRCDMTPGSCLPVADGTDPDGDCAGQEFECSQFTFGLMATSCYAGARARVSEGTCGIGGVCRPRGCLQLGAGVAISKCESGGCLKPGACPAGAPITDWDDPSALCNSGTVFECTMSTGDVGCCSVLGACCPAPSCAPDQGQCL